MSPDLDKEWDLVKAEGLLEETLWPDLRRRMEAGEVGPLDALLRDGLISAETLVRYRRSLTPAPNRDELATAKPGTKPQLPWLGDDSRPPIAAWRQFQIVRFLGKGGMGRVFLAHDTRLQRPVAIKFLRQQDPQLTRLFIREARSQARVDHPRVCKVFEAEDICGHPYIAMQYIDGEALATLARTLNLEQLLLIVKKVAEGLHVAHRAGLIHRDLKPSNIMIHTAEDGAHHPFILDFGLAAAELAHWEAGAGTPGFMAPEQKGNDVSLLDRRSDVFALGATLYALLTETSLDRRLSLDEIAVALRTKHADVPAEVTAIVAKCLRWEPSDRYPSARALAEDLNRFLEGDPVEALNAGWRYRVAKRIVKHRLAFSFLSGAFMLFLAALAWGSFERYQADQRIALARDLTSQVKDIQALSRLSFMSPRHDIRPDRQKMADRMARIRQSAKAAGKIGNGPGQFALGWGYLAQNDLEQARRHLERAWQGHYRPEGAAYGLGLAYIGLFRNSLARVQLLEDEHDRADLRQRLIRQFRQPALFYMEQARPSEFNSPYYLRALIAFCEARYEDALALLSRDRGGNPWFYETIALQADVYREMAVLAIDSGSNREAVQFLARADEAYACVLDIAPSDPALYTARVYALYHRAKMDHFRGRNFGDRQNSALEPLRLAEEVLPGNGETAFLSGKLQLLYARKILVREGDPSEHLDAAQTAAQLALQRGWSTGRSYELLGFVHWARARWLSDNKRDPRAEIERAVAALDRVSEQNRGDWFYNVMARAYRSWGKWLDRMGENPCDAYRQSMVAYRKGLLLRPQKIGHYSGLANTLVGMANHGECGRPKRVYLLEAAHVLRSALELNPNHAVIHYQQGRVFGALAVAGERSGHRWDHAFARRAENHYLKARDLNPKLSHVYNVLGLLYLAEARYTWRTLGAGGSLFRKSLETFATGRQLNLDSRLINQNMAWAYFFRGKSRVRQGCEPDGDLKRAERLVRKALANGRSLDALLCLASIFRIQAENRFNHEQDPAPFLVRSTTLLGELLRINPKFAEAHRSAGRNHLLLARHQYRLGQDPVPSLEAARAALDQALLLKPEVALNLIASARLSYFQAR